MAEEKLKARVYYKGEHYRNERLGEFINKTFDSASERAAAWETVRFIRESWPDCEIILRGKLIGVDTAVDREE